MKPYIISEDYTIKEVMMSFEENKERTAVVINANEQVVGVISQGDIVKALVMGVSMYSLVRQINKTSYIYLLKRDLEKAYVIFKEKKISLLPVVDSDARLVSIITLDDIFEYLEGHANA